MDTAQPEIAPGLARAWKLAIVSAAALAAFTKLLLAFHTYGTNDVYAWERFARWSALFGSRLYSIDLAFNHPPSMIHVLGALTWLAGTTGIAFPFWLRLPAILADAASLWIVSRIFADRLNEPVIRWTLLFLALSPTLILVSGFHGNTDPVVILFLLMAVWKADSSAASGAAFGAAMCIKIFPLIVLPVFFFNQPNLRRRAVFLASIAAVMIVCWSPYLFRDPRPILHQVVGYQSIYGHWGLTWIVCQIRSFPDKWHDAFQHYGAYVVLAIITAASFVINRQPTRPTLYAQTGAALFFFLATANGFGVQYIAWLVPWTLGVGLIPVAFFSVASGLLLFLVYNWWSGGFPWFLADSNYVGDYAGHLDYFLTACWVSVVVLAYAAWKWRAKSLPTRRTAVALSTFAALTLIYPAWNQFRHTDARTYPPTTDHAALTSIRAGERAMLSQAYYKMGRYTDAVVAARTGIALDPTQLDAWNSLAQACIQLGRWDEARNAADTAIRLAPNDETANANFTVVQGHR